MLGLGGQTLADMLRAEDAVGIRSSKKAIINLHLDGGPPQMDLIDPKRDAPSEIRGEFGSIRTKIPGFHVTELLPRLAANAGKYAFLRSLVGADPSSADCATRKSVRRINSPQRASSPDGRSPAASLHPAAKFWHTPFG